MTNVRVSLYESQLGLLDRAIESGRCAPARPDALKQVLLEHVGRRIAGAESYLCGSAVDDELRAAFPRYAQVRQSYDLVPITGKAFPVMRGEVLRIEQVGGGTCVDFNSFNLHDYKEALSCGSTRSSQAFSPGKGEFIWTNAPRMRPMYSILSIAETCMLDLSAPRCNRMYQDLSWDLIDHPNCQDTLAEAIREYGLTPDDVHDSFNLWMATEVDSTGRRQFCWNRAKPGDHIDLLASFDVLAVAAICGSGDLAGTSNFTFGPIKVTVFEASDSTSRLVDQIESRWMGRSSQDTTDDVGSVPIRVARALERDPAYEARFRPRPGVRVVNVPLDASEAQLVRALMATGEYGEDQGDAIRAAFMRWCNTNLTPGRRARLTFD